MTLGDHWGLRASWAAISMTVICSVASGCIVGAPERWLRLRAAQPGNLLLVVSRAHNCLTDGSSFR